VREGLRPRSSPWRARDWIATRTAGDYASVTERGPGAWGEAPPAQAGPQDCPGIAESLAASRFDRHDPPRRQKSWARPYRLHVNKRGPRPGRVLPGVDRVQADAFDVGAPGAAPTTPRSTSTRTSAWVSCYACVGSAEGGGLRWSTGGREFATALEDEWLAIARTLELIVRRSPRRPRLGSWRPRPPESANDQEALRVRDCRAAGPTTS
jgi:hypothetical protein